MASVHVLLRCLPQKLDAAVSGGALEGQDLYALMSCIRDMRDRAPEIGAAWAPLHDIVALLGKHGVQVRCMPQTGHTVFEALVM